MKENRLSNNNYGVFCIAAQLEQNNRELDVLWDKALKLYDEFQNSKFNNPEESELECINEFLNKKTEFEENHPEQLKLFLHKFTKLIDEFYPSLHLLKDVSRGFHIIEIAILDELNKDKEI